MRLKRGLRPELAGEYEHTVEGGRTGDWEPVVGSADELLSQPQWAGAPCIRVVVADWWARYAIVPWVDTLASASERLAHARALLAASYGEAVSRWDVQVSDAPPGIPRVACTMSAELIAAVRELCVRHSVRLVSLQPQMIVAYEASRQQLPETGAWFVSLGDGMLTAVRLTQRHWDRVYSVRIGPDWTRELTRLQTLGRLARPEGEESTVYVDATMGWREVAGTTGQDLHWLEIDAPPVTTLARLSRVRRMAA
ncbi:MAG: hypothetical protein JSR36_09610 [Proteobacteria bacterium]|nr:hypothetical protein [Pseudomonadota bacterium]